LIGKYESSVGAETMAHKKAGIKMKDFIALSRVGLEVRLKSMDTQLKFTTSRGCAWSG
jgi:hypothetical protein